MNRVWTQLIFLINVGNIIFRKCSKKYEYRVYVHSNLLRKQYYYCDDEYYRICKNIWQLIHDNIVVQNFEKREKIIRNSNIQIYFFSKIKKKIKNLWTINN